MSRPVYSSDPPVFFHKIIDQQLMFAGNTIGTTMRPETAQHLIPHQFWHQGIGKGCDGVIAT
ncbi:hypothetical protein [Ruegeria haliotis]|uniref:hypothetical protein n=1 Tax=Ruegeria haliotis TaxID=2747601 RepID=UPI001B7D87A5|nr:hypothetical protein [Ruegeria haliotis]